MSAHTSRSSSKKITQAYALVLIVTPLLGTIAAFSLLALRGEIETVTIIIAPFMYVISSLGVEVGFHRYLSHKGFRSGQVFRHFLLAAGSTAGQGPVLLWVATHRLHHREADTDLDPHSPNLSSMSRLRGAWHAHIGWVFDPPFIDVPKLIPDIMKQPDIFLYNRTYMQWVLLGLLFPTLVGFAFSGLVGALEGFLWGGLVRIFVQHHVTWSINSLCHLVGSTPYNTGEGSRNIAILSIVSVGGSWHNNHHAFPRSATNDHLWYQLDPGAWLIRSMRALGQVTQLVDGPLEEKGEKLNQKKRYQSH